MQPDQEAFKVSRRIVYEQPFGTNILLDKSSPLQNRSSRIAIEHDAQTGSAAA
jgi:hypothetical protein